MGIDPDEGIESVLFVLKQPGWSKRRGNKIITRTEMSRFWEFKRCRSNLLDRLQNIAMALIKVNETSKLLFGIRNPLSFNIFY